MSISIEQDLKEYLERFEHKLEKIDQKIDKLSDKVDQKIENLSDKIDQKIEKVDQKLENLSDKVDQKLEKVDRGINELSVGQTKLEGEIQTLEEKINGLDKRIESQVFVSRGVLVGLIIAILGGFAKLFGFMGNG